MHFERRFTTSGQDAYANIEFRSATSEIRNPDGTIVFQAENIEVPAQFSQVATDILAQKYFRKAGVPAALKRIEETSIPSWLWRSEADSAALAKLPEDQRYSGEMSAKQVFDRLPAHGLIGAGKVDISLQKRMPERTWTKCARC